LVAGERALSRFAIPLDETRSRPPKKHHVFVYSHNRLVLRDLASTGPALHLDVVLQSFQGRSHRAAQTTQTRR
jgi:hypothetical protein